MDYEFAFKTLLFIAGSAFIVIFVAFPLSYLGKEIWNTYKHRKKRKLEEREHEARKREDQYWRDNHRHRFELTKGAGPNYIWVCRSGPYQVCPDGYVLSWEKSKFRHMMLTDQPSRVEPYKE